MRIPSKRCSTESRIGHLLLEVYNLLYKSYGPRHWWPADNAFEVMVGAILTQNTNWINVERAIRNLRKERALTPSAIYSMSSKKLAGLIRPSGYYNIKTMRLKNFIHYLFLKYSGRLTLIRRQRLGSLRREMLGVKGLGPETVDSIILYALKKPIFVVDAYTRRIMNCQGIIKSDSGYEEIQSVFMKNLPKNVKFFNEYHALLVEHAKRVCRSSPGCQECVLRSLRKFQHSPKMRGDSR